MFDFGIESFDYFIGLLALVIVAFTFFHRYSWHTRRLWRKWRQLLPLVMVLLASTVLIAGVMGMPKVKTTSGDGTSIAAST